MVCFVSLSSLHRLLCLLSVLFLLPLTTHMGLQLYALLKEGEEDGQNLYFSDEDALFGDLEEGEEIQEDEEIFNLSTGWSVEAFDAGSLGSLGRGFAPAASGDGEDEGDDEDLGMAANQLLRSVPDHIVRRLEIEQQEADKVNRELQVKKAGGGGGTKPKTQRRLRIIAGTASSIRIHSQVRGRLQNLHRLGWAWAVWLDRPSCLGSPTKQLLFSPFLEPGVPCLA